MTHPEFITYLREEIEYAKSAATTDLEHARTYSYKAVCEDIYHEGKEERQSQLKQAARFHDGRAKGHEARAHVLAHALQHAESLDFNKPVDNTPQSG